MAPAGEGIGIASPLPLQSSPATPSCPSRLSGQGCSPGTSLPPLLQEDDAYGPLALSTILKLSFREWISLARVLALKLKKKKKMSGTSLAVKVLCFHYKAEQVQSLVGKKDPACCAVWPKCKKINR